MFTSYQCSEHEGIEFAFFKTGEGLQHEQVEKKTRAAREKVSERVRLRDALAPATGTESMQRSPPPEEHKAPCFTAPPPRRHAMQGSTTSGFLEPLRLHKRPQVFHFSSQQFRRGHCSESFCQRTAMWSLKYTKTGPSAGSPCRWARTLVTRPLMMRSPHSPRSRLAPAPTSSEGCLLLVVWHSLRAAHTNQRTDAE